MNEMDEAETVGLRPWITGLSRDLYDPLRQSQGLLVVRTDLGRGDTDSFID